MSRYRKVDPRIWNDAKFRALSDSAKLLFFMLLTHPNMTALGAMRGTQAGLAEEMGWSTEAFQEAFGEILPKGMAEHDQRACLIALPNFLRYNRPESPNVVKAWVGSLDLLPECDLKNRIIARSKAFAETLSEPFAEAFTKAFAEAFAKTMPYQEPEPEPEPEPKPEPEPNLSVDKSTGGKPPVAASPAEMIFSFGVPLLTAAGVEDRQARSFLGGRRKEYGDEAVIDKLRTCAQEKPLQPLTWLAAALPPKKPAGKHTGFASKDYRKGVTEDGTIL